MFHDTPVTRILVLEGELHIETDAFAFSMTETVPPGRIVITQVHGVFRNDDPRAAFEIESEDAEIYGLESTPDGVLLDLIWHYYGPSRTTWCTYWLPGAIPHIEALAGGPLAPIQDDE